METKVFSADVPTPLADKVDRMAERLERSRNSIVNQPPTDWIEREETHRRLTLEGMADVDAGRVFDHRRVQAWVESLPTEHAFPR